MRRLRHLGSKSTLFRLSNTSQREPEWLLLHWSISEQALWDKGGIVVVSGFPGLACWEERKQGSLKNDGFLCLIKNLLQVRDSGV